ncbi:uncharacterized protein LOC144442434 [Glandiceps talaboti]
MSRPIYTLLFSLLLIHGYVLNAEESPMNNEVIHEDPENDHLGEILARLTQLEDRYAELKEENRELKRLLAQSALEAKRLPFDDRDTSGNVRRHENGNVDLPSNTGDGSFDDVTEVLKSIDVIKNQNGGTEQHGTTPVNEVHRSQKTNGIKTQSSFKFYPSVREIVETANQNFNVPDIASPQDYLQVNQGSKSAAKEAQRLHLVQSQKSYNLEALSGQVKFLTGQFEALKSRLPMDMATDLASSKCAFSVARSKSLLGNNLSPQNITFDFKLANKGKYFDMRSGVFTCQIPGIYYFSFTMRSYDNKTIGVTLLKNGEAQVSMSTDPSERKVMQTQSVMLQLDEADQVWLQLGPHVNFAIYSNDYHYATFNGIILYITK